MLAFSAKLSPKPSSFYGFNHTNTPHHAGTTAWSSAHFNNLISKTHCSKYTLKKGGVKKKKRRVKYAQVLSVNVRAEYLFLLAVLLTVCLEGL